MQKLNITDSKQLVVVSAKKLLICMLIWWLLIQIIQILVYIICPNVLPTFPFTSVSVGIVFFFIECGFWMFFITFFIVALSVPEKCRYILSALALIFIIPLYNISFGLIGLKHIALLHLQLFHSTYEAKVQHILTGQALKVQTTCCDENPQNLLPNPERVRFHYADVGFGSYDIIYDPSGDVMSQDPHKRMEIGIFFAGAKHLADDWYLCEFRD